MPQLPEERERHIIVKLSVPSGSQVKDTKEFVASLFQLVDIVGTKFGSALRPDTKSKIRKTRDEFYQQLKIEATKEQKEEVCRFISDVVRPLRDSPFRLRKQSALQSTARNWNASPGSALPNNKRYSVQCGDFLTFIDRQS